MTISPDLMKAILSMDSYNRGYGAGINLLGGDTNGTKIGKVEILDKLGDADAQAAGFYAIAYKETGGSEVVISYRGTDDMLLDAITGWGIGTGSPYGEQAGLAFDFYKAVAGAGVDPTSANISLTGHSLGGGIAGLVGAVYGKSASLFDNMPFEVAASKIYEYAVNPSAAYVDAINSGGDHEYATAMQEKAEQLTASIYENVSGGSVANQLDNLSGDYIDGEFLEFVRAKTGQTTVVSELDLGPNVDLNYIDSISGQRHDMALLVIRKYAEENSSTVGTNWRSAAEFLWPTLYSDSLGEVVHNNQGGTTTGGLLVAQKFSELMRQTIAYSAIDSGTTIFGNTGIKAFYNDANDFGEALDNGAEAFDQDLKDGIAEVVAQYAGQLALGKVEGDAAAIQGVLTHVAGMNRLDLDFSLAQWSKGDVVDATNIVGREKILDTVLEDNFYSPGGVEPGADLSSISKKVEKATFATSPGGAHIVTGAENDENYSLFVGSDGIDNVSLSSGNDLAFLGDGDDYINFSGGNDHYVGGDGTDTLDMSSVSKDVVFKQKGWDGFKVTTEDGDTTSISSIEKVYTGSGTTNIKTVAQNVDYYLGSGETNALQLGEGSQVHVGSGQANIAVSNNIQIVGAKDTDEMSAFGQFKLSGAIADAGSESTWVLGNDGARYAVNVEGDLVIKDKYGAETFIANYNVGMAGITVGKVSVNAYNIMDSRIPANWQQGHFEVVNALAKANGGDAIYQGVDPLVLDLDGDGVELNDVTSSAPTFDMNGNGFAVHTGWVRPNDGMLVMDKNSNGQIDDIDELFGDSAQDGFAALSEHDQNTDGVIDASDADFADLRIWRDLNGDGITDAGELQTMAEVGIASISTTGVDQNNKQVSGNQILSEGTFTRTDGTTGTVSDVSFHVDNFNTEYQGDKTVSVEAAAMPNLKGFGTLTDLHVAMTQDPALITIVQNGLSGLNSLDLVDLRAAATPILTAWAASVQLPDASGVLAPVTPAGHSDAPLLVVHGNDGITVSDFGYEFTDAQGTYWKLASGQSVEDGQGNVIDRPTLEQVMAQTSAQGQWEKLTGAQLDFIERYTGDIIPIGGVPHNASATLSAIGPVVNLLYQSLNIVSIALAMEGPLASYFTGIEYDATDNMFRATTVDQLVPMYKAIFAAAPADATGTENWLSSWAPVLDIVIRDFKREGNLDVTYAYRFSNVVAAYEAVGLPVALTDAAVAFGIPSEQIVAGTGDLTGTEENDIFYISGAQTASGGAGPDNYVIGSSFDGAVIHDMEEAEILTGSEHSDILRFTSLKSTEVSARRDGLDLILTDTVNNQTLIVTNHFMGRLPMAKTGGSNKNPQWGVVEITFADGVVWDRMDIAWNVAPNTDGVNGVLNGSSSGDVLDSSRGNHMLSGGDNADIYLYKKGNGHVTFEDNALSYLTTLAPDVVNFDNSITYDDLIFSRDGNSNNLVVNFKDNTTDSITLKNQFDYYHNFDGTVEEFDRIEVLRFADGSYVTWSEIQEILIKQDTDVAGGDIYGFGTADVIDIGSTGGHLVVGGNQQDTYLVGANSGNNTIQEGMTNAVSGVDDEIVFGEDVDSNAVQVVRNEDSYDVDLVISPTSKLTIKDQFSSREAAAATGRIENFKFESDPSVMWTHDDIRKKAIQNQIDSGTHRVFGFATDDVIDAGVGGDDYMSGSGGSDTYKFGLGYGHDQVEDKLNDIILGDDDRILFNTDVDPSTVTFERGSDIDDLAIRLSDGSQLDVIGMFGSTGLDEIESFEFQDVNSTVMTVDDVKESILSHELSLSNHTVYGFDGGSVLDGYAGNNTLIGLKGNNTYVFGLGYGQQIVKSISNTTIGSNKVKFGAGITPDMLQMSRTDDDLVISLTGHTDTLTIEKQFAFVANPEKAMVEQFEFDDASVWSISDITQALIAQEILDPSNVTLEGYSGDDVLTTTATGGVYIKGNDGNDTITGNIGKDTLDGGKGNDVLDAGVDVAGRTDSDKLIGGSGVNTYIFGRGYGEDRISNINSASTLLFKDDVSPSDVIVTKGSYHLELSIAGTDDKVVIENYSYSSVFRIADVQFADGTVWDQTALASLATGTSGDDVLTGDASDNVFHGQSGNDTLQGFGGNDTLYGGEGNDTLEGGDGNDTLNGGAGNDALVGGDGNNTYIFGRGCGVDTINNDHLDVGTSVLQFNSDTASTDIAFSRSGDDLVMSISGTVDRITVSGYFSGMQTQVSSILFDDGTSYAPADINAMFAGPTDGDDALVGTTADDVMDGGLGNDTLTGVGGNNTYVFGRGYGQDVVNNHHTDSGLSVLSFKVGVNPGDVVTSRTGDNLVFSISGTTDQITVENYFMSDAYKITNAQFSDGTIWNNAVITELLSAGTSGNDILTGDASNNVFHGQAGNDTIQGLGGDDTLYGGAGDDYIVGGAGKDDIDTGSGDDTVVINGGDVIAGEILAGGEGNDKIVVGEINLSGMTITGFETLKVWNSNAWIGLTAEQMETFSTLTMEYENVNIYAVGAGTYDLSNKIVHGTFNLYGSDGDDVLIGNYVAQTIYAEGGNDIVRGGAGDDNLQGVTGNDDIYGDLGNDILDGGAGFDRLYGEAGDDVLQVGAGQAVAGEIVDGGEGTDTLISSGTNLSIINIQNVEVFKAWDNGTWIGMSADQFNSFDSFVAQGGTANVWAASSGNFSLDGKTTTGRINVYGTGSSDTLVGNADAQTLSGEGGNDTIDGKGGADWLSGGAGNDTYIYGRGYGAGTVSDSDWSGPNEDALLFGADVAKDQLWFEQSGNDLLVSIIGTNDNVAIKDWYSGSGNHVEKIQTADGSYLLDSAVQNMVNAMASFTPPAQTALPANYQTTLNPVIAANWAV